MAKKKGDDIKSIVLDLIKGQVLTRIVDAVTGAIETTQKKIVRTIVAVILILMGVLFLIVGGTFFTTDVLGFSRTAIYLIVGAALLLIGIIFGQSARLLQYKF